MLKPAYKPERVYAHLVPRSMALRSALTSEELERRKQGILAEERNILHGHAEQEGASAEAAQIMTGVGAMALERFRAGARKRLEAGETINLIDTFRDYRRLVTLGRHSDTAECTDGFMRRVAVILTNAMNYPSTFFRPENGRYNSQPGEFWIQLQQIGALASDGGMHIHAIEQHPDPSIQPVYDQSIRAFDPQTLEIYDPLNLHHFSLHWGDCAFSQPTATH